ncbi:PQ-loop repeat family protein, partial [Tanacetum coccineum]
DEYRGCSSILGERIENVDVSLTTSLSNEVATRTILLKYQVQKDHNLVAAWTQFHLCWCPAWEGGSQADCTRPMASLGLVVFSECKIESVDSRRKDSHDKIPVESSTVPILSKISQSLQIPAADDNSSPERVYYSSARSLSRSHTPTLNYFHSQRSSPRETVEEPLLGGDVSGRSPPASQTKTLLCVVFTATIFLCTYNLKLERDGYLNSVSETPHNGIVMQVGRKLLQVTGSLTEGSEGTESSGIGTYLGWGMAAIYMGGRLPQIFLNFKRGNVQHTCEQHAVVKNKTKPSMGCGIKWMRNA